MQLDQVAQQKMDEILAIKPLENWGIADRDQLAAYCAAYSRWKRAEDYLATPGNGPVITIEDDKGGVKQHAIAPEVRVSEGAAKEMARIAKLLLLNRLQPRRRA